LDFEQTLTDRRLLARKGENETEVGLLCHGKKERQLAMFDCGEIDPSLTMQNTKVWLFHLHYVNFLSVEVGR
jgi:hypothetical protein